MEPKPSFSSAIQTKRIKRKHIWVAIIFIFTLFTDLTKTRAQVISNQGSEFWVAFPTHVPDVDRQFNPLLAELSLFITGPSTSSGSVSVGSFYQRFNVTANQVTEVRVPRAACYIDEAESGLVLENRGIHIVVDKGLPKVVLYAHIFAGQRSAASLILPAESLGNHYHSMNFPQHDTEGKNFITVVAATPNITLHIRKSGAELVPGGITLHNVNDTYEYLSTTDLSGVEVSSEGASASCDRFAMFCGSSGIYIAPSSCTPKSLDPLFQQCYTIANWGTDYGYIPFSTISPSKAKPVRTKGQYIRVVAKDPGTSVSINGTIVAMLDKGSYYTSPEPLTEPAFIHASNPIMVAQYALSQSCSNSNPPEYGFSDPDMVLLNPLNFSINDVTVYSATRENISEQYLNILIPSDAIDSFRINEKLPTGTFKGLASLPGYAYAQIDLSAERGRTFHLSAGAGFNAIAYGFGDVESYAYSAGTNLASSASVSAIRKSDKQVIDSACVNDDYSFRLRLSFQAQQITWKMDKDESETVQTAPKAIPVSDHGRQSFEYDFSKTAAYQMAGVHHYTITPAFSASDNNCNSDQQTITGDFKVNPLPVFSITAKPDDCGHFFSFAAKGANPSKIKTFIWNFGDPSSGIANYSNLSIPVHNYIDTGIFIVSLTILSQNDCQAVSYDTVHIGHIQTDIRLHSSLCQGNTIHIEDEGKNPGQAMFMRKWFFGDGDSTTTTTNSVEHRYTFPGKYLLKLVATSRTGCTGDTASNELTISEKPVPDFVAPAICLSDGTAKFINKSHLNLDQPPGGLTFRWSFGDSQSVPDNLNYSTLTNPTHRFTATGVYKISLTVSSPDRCDSTITRDFTVNGIQPKAEFTILGTGALCCNQPILFRNEAYVLDFGTIKRLVFYFNADRDRSDSISIVNPAPGQIYSHIYPAFNHLSDDGNRTVRVLAFSGEGCVDSLSRTLTIQPAPQLNWSKVENFCINDQPRQLTGAEEISGISGGQGYFSGAGVSATGIFDPLAAGLGPHKLYYHFNSITGCSDSISQTITVLNPPTVESNEIIYLLQGEETYLRPVYSANSVTFHWYPALGLNGPYSSHPLASPTTSTDYQVEVSNGACSATATVHVKVLVAPIIPNAFSPNGDGINDTWEIPNLNDYPSPKVMIFNRYGILLYHSNGYGHPWDGTFQGKKVPGGTYYYLIVPGNSQKKFSGPLTVIR